MKKINYMLFHSFERKRMTKSAFNGKFYQNLHVHLTKLITNLQNNKEFKKEFSSNFVIFTIIKKNNLKEFIHKN